MYVPVLEIAFIQCVCLHGLPTYLGFFNDSLSVSHTHLCNRRVLLWYTYVHTVTIYVKYISLARSIDMISV